MLGVRNAFREVAKSVRGMQQENDQLKAENAKLRRDVAETSLMLGGAWKHCTELRELVADMWSYFNAPVNQRNNLKERLAIYDDLAERMRDLGVEVHG